MATTMTDQCANSPTVVGIVSFHSSSSYFATAATMHHYSIIAAWTTQHNNQFSMEAAAPMAPMPTMMLIVTSSEGYCRLPGTKPYVFLCRTQPTTNPQRPSTRHDQMADCGHHGALLPALTQTTVAQNVGGSSYAVALGVGHHGGRGTAATAKVGGARFS
jgi:hypothetical protein